MKREHFETRNHRDWQSLERALDLLEAGQAMGSAAEFPALYRRVCHHLALVRHRRFGADLEGRLNHLVIRGHRQLYRARGHQGLRPFRFLLVEFPRRVRAEARLGALATLLFFAPLAGAFAAATLWPAVALSIVPGEELNAMAGQYGPSTGATVERDANTGIMMFGYYVHNNVAIAFRTFAAGIFAGIGSVFFLLYNGLVIGTVTAHVRNLGFDEAFFSFVVGHAAFELTAIVLAGVAGLRLGLAVVAPGRARRIPAVAAAARRSLPVLYGCAAMLLLAALVEAFWSPSDQPAAVKMAAGAVFWIGVAGFFAFAGRREEP